MEHEFKSSTEFYRSQFSACRKFYLPGAGHRLSNPWDGVDRLLLCLHETFLFLINSQTIEDLRRMKISSAHIDDSCYLPYTNTAHKFTAGLVLGLTLDATIENITNIEDVRVKVLYPDKQAHILVPIPSHFRLISRDEHSETCSYRLYSTVNVSHSVWNQPSSIEISIILDFRDNQSTMIDLNEANKTRSLDDSQIIEISKAVQFKIHPHVARW